MINLAATATYSSQLTQVTMLQWFDPLTPIVAIWEQV